MPGLMSVPDALKMIEALQKEGKKVVFTNGCFDLIHIGHATYLSQARELGDCLVVGINSDESVKRLKGKNRPYMAEADRGALLAMLKPVDIVVVFSEDTPESIIARLKPDIHVKGGDYTEDQLPEAAVVRSYGGNVVIMPFVEGHSTTGLVKRIALAHESQSGT